MRPIDFRRRWLIVLATSCALPLLAQDAEQQAPDPQGVETEQPAAAEAPAAPPPPRQQEEEDAFVPSEELSLDKSVAFPADI